MQLPLLSDPFFVHPSLKPWPGDQHPFIPFSVPSYASLCHFDDILHVILYWLHVYLLTFSLKKSMRPCLPFLLYKLNAELSQPLLSLLGVQYHPWHIDAR